MYVVDLAPVTSQEWFHQAIGYTSGGVSAVGTFAVIYQFFGDSILTSNIAWIKESYDSIVYPNINSLATQSISFF